MWSRNPQEHDKACRYTYCWLENNTSTSQKISLSKDFLLYDGVILITNF